MHVADRRRIWLTTKMAVRKMRNAFFAIDKGKKLGNHFLFISAGGIECI